MKGPSGLLNLPCKGERIGRYVTVRGVVQNIPLEKDLWVAHRRVAGGLIWPKEPNIVSDDNGEFSINTFEGGAPGNLVISLLFVAKPLSNDFRSWLERGHKTGGLSTGILHYSNIVGSSKYGTTDVLCQEPMLTARFAPSWTEPTSSSSW